MLTRKGCSFTFQNSKDTIHQLKYHMSNILHFVNDKKYQKAVTRSGKPRVSVVFPRAFPPCPSRLVVQDPCLAFCGHGGLRLLGPSYQMLQGHMGAIWEYGGFHQWSFNDIMIDRADSKLYL